MDEEMMRALKADGEKLAALTGEDHGPVFVVDDGGPAFPIPDERDLVTGCGIMQGAPGMSLRAYLAAHVPVPRDGVPENWARSLVPRAAPDWLLDGATDCIEWWAEAEARYRVLHADAMIRVLREPARREGSR